MAVTEEDTRRAAADERRKMDLEKTFIPEIKSLFARMARVNSENIIATGRTIDAQDFREEWGALLRKHYLRTQEGFGGRIDEPTDEQSELIALGMLTWRNGQVKQQADFITATNSEDIRNSEVAATATLLEEQGSVDNKSLALTATALLRKNLSGRVGAIAMTETQSAAERTKLTEAEVFAGLQPSSVQPTIRTVEETKMWVTMGDGKVRPAHRAANGQEVPIDTPFQVGTSLLRHPGDSSLGADAGQVCNCRCATVFRFMNA